MTPEDAVACVIVTYNSESDIEACILSALESPEITSIVVLDNMSTDGTLRVLDAIRDDRVRVIRNAENVGFAKAVNIGVALTQEPFILLLNPDCEVRKGALAILLQEIRRSSARPVGVAAPLITHPDGRLTVRSAGYEPSSTHLLFQAFGLPALPRIGKIARGFNLYHAGEEKPSTAVDWVSGACLLTPRSVWERVNGMNERWFMYGEDLEYCAQVRDLGLRVVHNGDAHATHVVGASSSESNGPVWTLWVENLADYYLKRFRHGRFREWWWRTTLAFFFHTRSARYFALSLLSSSQSKEVWRKEVNRFRAYARAARTRS